MPTPKSCDLEFLINQFEDKLLEALEFKYANDRQEVKTTLIEYSFVKTMNIREFYTLYIEKGFYPRERIETLVYKLFDIKIQMFYILELDLGLYNRLIYDLGFDNNNINNFPYVALKKLSLDQTLIVKSRILWERIMNFIYYLETGEDLEGKSKKTKFFKFIKDKKWSYLEDYKDYIEWFDDTLRTPEVHKGSILRKYFQTEIISQDNKILGIIGIASNAIWANLLEIIQGNQPRQRYWKADMGNLPGWLPPP